MDFGLSSVKKRKLEYNLSEIKQQSTLENSKVSPAHTKPKSEITNPVNIIRRCQKEGRPVRVAGPMVRYSKLPFRQLMAEYKADIVYSPMMLAREFVRNNVARDSDFSTNHFEDGYCFVVQVGTNNVTDLLRFVEMVHPYCDGIGLNCGCPVREQVREGIGAALMSDSDRVVKFVKAVKSKFPNIPMETKIRIHDDIIVSIEFVKKLDKAGVDWITIHGRTKDTRSSAPANIEAIKTLASQVSCPVIANGDCFESSDATKISEYTGCAGVMAVRGIMANPALFDGFSETPWGAIELFMDHCIEYGFHYRLIQHQLSCMFPVKGVPQLTSRLKAINEASDFVELLDILDENFDLRRRGDTGFGENRPISKACKFELATSESADH